VEKPKKKKNCARNMDTIIIIMMQTITMMAMVMGMIGTQLLPQQQHQQQ
jgi:hypothetical protein